VLQVSKATETFGKILLCLEKQTC